MGETENIIMRERISQAPQGSDREPVQMRRQTRRHVYVPIKAPLSLPKLRQAIASQLRSMLPVFGISGRTYLQPTQELYVHSSL